ncbi:3-dehydroquinate synthase [Rhodovibrionaceae bacterium A322]
MELNLSAYERLTVDLGDRSYDILVGDQLIATAGQHISPLLKKPRVLVVTDSHVAELHLPALERSLSQEGIAVEAFVLPAGEGTKNFSHLSDLCSRLLAAKIDRNSLLVALGGGVIGDLTGFAASILLRGIDFVQIPTTLLAQVDSSVGGKTGINTPEGKNLVGAFHQPRLVLADTGALATLPDRQLKAGYAEVVKYGLINDPAFFAWLEGHGHLVIEGDSDASRKAVLTSCQAKADIVSQDEKELGMRALLNLGHTFGHALEAECGYGDELLHGEAVSIGMQLAFDLSVQLGLCPAEDADRLRRHLIALDLPCGFGRLRQRSWSADILMNHMTRDKKVKDGRVTFILARGIGQSFQTNDVDPKELERLLNEALMDILDGNIGLAGK